MQRRPGRSFASEETIRITENSVFSVSKELYAAIKTKKVQTTDNVAAIYAAILNIFAAQGNDPRSSRATIFARPANRALAGNSRSTRVQLFPPAQPSIYARKY